jgi:hypothetical protein
MNRHYSIPNPVAKENVALDRFGFLTHSIELMVL